MANLNSINKSTESRFNKYIMNIKYTDEINSWNWTMQAKVGCVTLDECRHSTATRKPPLSQSCCFRQQLSIATFQAAGWQEEAVCACSRWNPELLLTWGKSAHAWRVWSANLTCGHQPLVESQSIRGFLFLSSFFFSFYFSWQSVAFHVITAFCIEKLTIGHVFLPREWMGIHQHPFQISLPWQVGFSRSQLRTT